MPAMSWTMAKWLNLLTPDFGFQACPEGWTIPDMVDQRQAAAESLQVAKTRASALGRAGAAARWKKPEESASYPKESTAGLPVADPQADF